MTCLDAAFYRCQLLRFIQMYVSGYMVRIIKDATVMQTNMNNLGRDSGFILSHTWYL
jgi:hypothetical protein